MKLNDLPEIGFDRQKNADPHSPTDQAQREPRSLQSSSRTHSHLHGWPAQSAGPLSVRRNQEPRPDRVAHPQRARPHPCQPGQPQAPPHANSFDSNDNGFVRPILHPARIGALDAQLRTNPPNRAQPAPAPRTQHPAPAREARHPHPLAFCRNIRHHRIPHPIPKAGYK